MTLDEFIHGLETYGADFDRWPERHAEAARQLCRTLPEAAARQIEARHLEALFARDRDQPADAARLMAITQAALAQIRAKPALVPARLGRHWLFPGALGAALAASVLAGWFSGVALTPHGDISALATLLGFSSDIGGL